MHVPGWVGERIGVWIVLDSAGRARIARQVSKRRREREVSILEGRWRDIGGRRSWGMNLYHEDEV